MTGLGCNVTTCAHNDDKCCCLTSIKVHGCNADKCDDTCCGSYEGAKSTTASNSCKTPKQSLDVACEAANCIYNTNNKCLADHINISGVSASEASETVCASFKSR